MTEWTRAPLEEIRTLADERVRYEGWLTALEERRASTTAHVFERVRQDYEGRLRRVLDSLSAHAGALRTDESTLATRHAEATRLLDEQRDALAEIELRALVGEYDEAHATRLRTEAEQTITERERESGAVEAELREVRALLERAIPAGGVVAAGAPAADAGYGAPDGGIGGGGEAAATTAGSPGDLVGTLDGAPATTPTGSGWPESTVRGGDRDGFGYGGGYAPVEPRRRDTPAHPPAAYAGQGFADAAFDTAGASTPVGGAGSAAGGVTAQKTLRCQDCGEMNYPTEWYCERCGGELAAL